jgi:hypothetical protein
VTDDYRRAVDTKVHWGTPDAILDRVRRVAPIGLDPCSNNVAQRHVRARVAWFGPPDDGLALPWRGYLGDGALAYVNPPYGGALRPWSEKMAGEASLGCQIITLVPSSTGTRWWRMLLSVASCVCFVAGRLQHLDCAADPDFDDRPAQLDFWGTRPVEDTTDTIGATFDSALLYLYRRSRPWRFAEAFDDVGDLWFPT